MKNTLNARTPCRRIGHGVMAAACLLFSGNALAQNCPVGSTNSLAPYDNQSPSQTVINGNQVFVGNSRLQLAHQTFGSAVISTNNIDNNHIESDVGVRIGHSRTVNATSNYIVSTYDFRNPANLGVYLPVTSLRFRLHDIDAGDSITVNAYDQNGTLISIAPGMFTSGPYVNYASPNRFWSTNPVDAGEFPGTELYGTVDLDFSGYQVRSVVLRYNDTEANGSYTVAGFAGCNAALTLNKTTVGGSGGPFGFSLTNTTSGSGSVSTTSANTPAQVGAYGINSTSTAVTINENSLPAGWLLTGATCTNAANVTVGSLSGSAYTIPGASIGPSANISCTFTNTLRPRVTIRKISNGGVGAFTFTGTNGIANQTLTTTVPGTAVSGAVQTLTTIGGGATITESAPPAGYTLTTASCTGLPTGGTATPDLGARTLTLNAAATASGANLVCTFTNTLQQPRLTLIKTVTNDNGGTQPASAWTLSAAGPMTISGATGSATVTNAAVTPGTYALSESATPTGYVASLYSCVRNGGAAVVGNSITLAAVDTAICTINNDDSNQTDLSIEKAASPGPIVSGGQVAFTLVVRNLGVAAAHGAVVRDPAMAGLDCLASGLPAPTCSATGSATCPSPLTASGLQAGTAIPALPNGGIVTIGLTCRVTASGLP